MRSRSARWPAVRDAALKANPAPQAGCQECGKTGSPPEGIRMGIAWWCSRPCVIKFAAKKGLTFRCKNHGIVEAQNVFRESHGVLCCMPCGPDVASPVDFFDVNTPNFQDYIKALSEKGGG